MTKDKINQASLANQDKAKITLESTDLFIPANNQANVSWLSLKEASKYIGKSHAMIKLLVAQNKVESKKIKAKYGFEIRVNAGELKEYYKEVDSQDNQTLDSLDKASIISEGNNQAISQASLDNQKDAIHFRIIESKLEFLTNDAKVKSLQIEKLENDKAKLYEDIEARRSEQERFLKLFENQQSLMLSLQQQMKTLTDAVTPTNFNAPRNDQNTNQKEYYITEVKDNSKRKKWWFF